MSTRTQQLRDDWQGLDQSPAMRRFLLWLNFAVLAGAGIAVITQLMASDMRVNTIVMRVFSFSIAVLSIWQLRYSASRSVLVLTIGFWCIAAVNAVVFAGVHSSAMVLFPFVVAMAGWLLGSTSLIVATVATVLFVVGIAYAEWSGQFIPTGRANVIAVTGIYLAVVPVISFLTYGARKSLMTSRKQALDLSHDMVQQNAVLRERETEIHNLLENMPAAVASFDVHSNLRQCNRRYAALYGVEPAAILGKHVSAYAPQVVQEQIREAGRGALRGQPQSYRRFNVHPQTHAVTWLDVGVTPQFENGIVVGLYTVLVDVTDKVQAEAEIMSLNTELEQRVERRTRELASANESLQSSHDELVRSQAKAGLVAMVASVSHELGTPVGNSVLISSTFTDLARELGTQLDSGQVRKSSLQALQHSLSEGSAMLNRNLERAETLLKNFRQVSADQASEQCRAFDLAAVVAEVVASMGPVLRRSTHRLVLEIPAGIGFNSLPGPLGQVLINLINNAYMHAFEGRSDGVLTISALERGDDVLLQVKDNGNGMTPNVQQQIFEPFFSTRIGSGGTGLGMGIVHNIVVKMLGGDMSVHSELGQGTRFDIRLPRRAPSAPNT